MLAAPHAPRLGIPLAGRTVILFGSPRLAWSQDFIAEESPGFGPRLSVVSRGGDDGDGRRDAGGGDDDDAF